MTTSELITLFKENVKKSGHTQKEIAKETGITESTVSRVLHGKNRFLSQASVDKIVKYLNLNEDFVLDKSCPEREINLSIDTKQLILGKLNNISAEVDQLKQILENEGSNKRYNNDLLCNMSQQCIHPTEGGKNER